MDEFHKKGISLMKHTGGWTNDDFAYFGQVIAGDGDKPSQFAVLALGQLAKVDQCRRALTIVGRRRMDSAAMKAVWLDTFEKWSANSSMRPLVSEVIGGDNPDLAHIGKEVVSGSTTSN